MPPPEKHPSATATTPKRPQLSAQTPAAVHKWQDKSDKAMSDKASDISKARSGLAKRLSVNTASNSTKLLSNDSVATFIDQPLNESVTADLYYIESAPERLLCSVGDAMVSSSALYGWTTRDVRVKRAKPPSPVPSKDEPKPPAFLLTDRSRDESLEVYSPETSMLTSRVAALQKDLKDEIERNRVKQQQIDSGLRTQEAALKTWSDSRKCTWLQQSHLDRMTGNRGVEKTLFHQSVIPPLPPLQRHWAPSLGSESDFPQGTQGQRFYNRDAFFLLPERLGGELDGIACSLPWSKRQLYKPPLSIVRPPISGETFLPPPAPSAKLSRLQSEVSGVNVSVHWRDIWVKGYTDPSCEEVARQRSHACVSARDYPLRRQALQGLVVHGEQMELVDQSNDNDDSESTDDMDLYNTMIRNSKSTTSMSSRSSRRRFSVSMEPCGPRTESPYFVRYTVPAFKIDRYSYIWNQIPMRGIVEIGVVCDAGSSTSTAIRLANHGCCVMRYSWRQLPHTDHFNTGRYRTPTFIFDHKEGVLLPEEKVSLPVLFKPPYAGKWTEKWIAQTTPHVGPGTKGEISVALYGYALEVDVNLRAREELESELFHSSIVRLCERIVWDLIKFLPIREPQTLEKENIPPIPHRQGADDVKGFLARNPGLYYHSTAMAKLLTVHTFLHLTSSTATTKEEHDRKDLRKESDPQAANMASIASNKDSSQRLPNEENSESDTSFFSTKKSVDDFGQPRAQLRVHSLYQEARNATGPLACRKEDLLRSLNEAIVQMHHKPCAPPMRHYKRLLAHTALVGLMDEVGQGEWRLRRSLGLLQHETFSRRASFLPESATEKGKGAGKGRPTSKTRKSTVTQENRPPLPQQHRHDLLAKSPGEAAAAGATRGTVSAPHLYHERLYALIYQLLGKHLADFLPILTYDGYHLDPSARKQAQERGD